MREDQLQKAVAKLLDSAGMVWTHVPMGGNRSAKTGALMKAMGAKAGVPDVLIFDPMKLYAVPVVYKHIGLAIELKVGKNKPTPTQLEWRDKLTGCDWLWVCCYSVDEVLAVLRKHYPHRFPI
jgi:hypothetical protein